MMEKLRWGILGTGNITDSFARSLKTSRTGLLKACGGRRPNNTSMFAKRHGIANAHDSLTDLLGDPDVYAI